MTPMALSSQTWTVTTPAGAVHDVAYLTQSHYGHYGRLEHELEIVPPSPPHDACLWTRHGDDLTSATSVTSAGSRTPHDDIRLQLQLGSATRPTSPH